MKYYRTYSWQRPSQFEEVEVEKETDESIWINGYRHAKVTQSEWYFKTLTELRRFRIARYQASIEILKKQIDGAEGMLKEAESIPEN